MNLAIDVDSVTHVLLGDGWHEVVDKSFTVAPYEYGRTVATGDGAPSFELVLVAGGASPMGFAFDEARTGASMCGPLASVVAVRRQQR